MSTPTRITHLIAGSALGGDRRAHRARSSTRRPASRPASSTSPRADLVGEVVARRQGGVGGRVGQRLPRQAHPGPLQVPRAPRRAQGGDRGAHHRRARQGPLGRPGRGHPRSRGRRVRLRHPASAQGRATPRTPRPASTCTRSASRSASSPSSRRSTSRPWSRCGSSRSPSPPATPSSSSRARRTRARPSPSPSCGPRPASPTAIMNVVNGDKEAVDALLTHPDIRSVSFVGSTPIARYVYETGHGQRQAGPGPRRGEEPHARPSRRRPRPRGRRRRQRRLRLGRRAVHGDLGRCWPSTRSATSSSRRSPTGWASSSPATAPAPATWARWSPRQHRDKVASYLDAGTEAGATLVVDGRTASSTAQGEDGYFLAPTLFDNVTPEMSIYTDEIFGPVLSVVRVQVLRRGPATSSTPTPTATARRSSPTTAAPPAASRTRSRSG